MRKKKYSAKAAAIVISCSLLAASLSLTGCIGNKPEPIKPTKPGTTQEETSEISSTKEDSTEETSTEENTSEMESSTEDPTEEESSETESSEEESSEEESEQVLTSTPTPTTAPVLPPTNPPAPPQIPTPVPTSTPAPKPTSTPTPVPKPTNTPTPTPTPKPHVHELEYIGVATPTCQHAGHNEYYKCKTCGKYFWDHEAKYEAKGEADFFVDKTDHIYNYAPFKYPNCETNGCIGYYYCDMCDTWWVDAGGKPGPVIENHADAFTPAYGHHLVLKTLESPSCEDAYVNVEHYECTECGELFLDIDCESPTTWDYVYAAPSSHSMIYVDKILPHDGEHGFRAHWHCVNCGKNYADQYGMVPMNEQTILLHEASPIISTSGITYVCPICHKSVNENGIPLDEIKG